MDKTIYLDSIDQYNKLYGLKSLRHQVWTTKIRLRRRNNSLFRAGTNSRDKTN